MLEKIVSGGQTGADRAALDWALRHRLPHGGWCPQGRLTEDGPLATRYKLVETPSPDPAQRTEWNVRDSQATVLFSIIPALSGGSRLTAEVAQSLGRPLLHLSRVLPTAEATSLLADFLDTHSVRVLNVAGPRASSEPGVAVFVTEVLNWFSDLYL